MWQDVIGPFKVWIKMYSNNKYIEKKIWLTHNHSNHDDKTYHVCIVTSVEEISHIIVSSVIFRNCGCTNDVFYKKYINYDGNYG